MRMMQKSQPLPARKKWRLVIFGALAGLVNGLFGSGGGMVVVPALKWVGVETHHSHATALAVIFPLSLISAVVYYFQQGSSIPGETWVIAAASVVGALAGACLLQKLKTVVLEVGLSLVMIASAVRMLWPSA